MRITCSSAVVLFVLIGATVNIGYVESYNFNCSVAKGEPQDCVKISDCPVVKNLLKYVTVNSSRFDVSNITLDYLHNIHCGWLGEAIPMVCCPPQVDPQVNTGAGNLHRHENLHLLTKHDCGQSHKERIIGGDVADLFEFPWMALLAYNAGKIKVYRCGGSLISDKYVLTAAHCINNWLAGVRIGEHDISSSPDCFTYLGKKYCAPPVQDFQIDKCIKHENHRHETYTNDIALIRLKGTVNLTINALPICLPIYNSLQNVQLEGQSVYVAGWGVAKRENPSNELLKISVKITTNIDCIEKFDREFIFENNLHLTGLKFCAGEAGKDVCSGDSGGALIYPGLYQRKVRYIQYGIVSYGSKSCNTKTPGIYTKLTKYLNWILDNISS